MIKLKIFVMREGFVIPSNGSKHVEIKEGVVAMVDVSSTSCLIAMASSSIAKC